MMRNRRPLKAIPAYAPAESAFAATAFVGVTEGMKVGTNVYITLFYNNNNNNNNNNYYYYYYRMFARLKLVVVHLPCLTSQMTSVKA